MKRSNTVCFISLGALSLIGLCLFVAVNPLMDVFGSASQPMNLPAFLGNVQGEFALKGGYILLTLFQIFSILFAAFAMMRMAAKRKESGFVWSVVTAASFLVQFAMMIAYFPSNAFVLSCSIVGFLALIAGSITFGIFLSKEKQSV